MTGWAASALPLAWRLARRELRGGLKGLRVFWLCLMLGVTIIAAVGSVSAAVVGGLNADARALLGGDVTIQVNHREIAAEPLAYLHGEGRVSVVAETRTMIRTRDNARQELAELKGVDAAYPLYGVLELEPPQAPQAALGQDAAGQWGTALDRRLLQALDLHVGDLVRIGEGEYKVRAVIQREPDRSGRSLLFGATVLVARASLPSTHLIVPGSLVRFSYRLALPPERDSGLWAQEFHSRFPDTGWRVRTMQNATPRVERLVENLSDFLQLVGLTALLVGGVGVSNAVSSYLTGKARSIATMKCLGASTTLVFQTYLLQTMTLAATGVVAGLVVGAAAPVLLVRLLGPVLPVPLSIGVYPGPLLLAAAYGLLTALVFSLLPLARVRDVPAAEVFRGAVVRPAGRPGARTLAAVAVGMCALAALAVVTTAERANAAWFIGGATATLGLFYGVGRAAVALARMAGRPAIATLRLALTNLYRPGAPTTSVVVSLGLGLTLLVALALVEGNLMRQVRQTLPQQAPNFFFIDIQPAQVEGFEELVRAVPGEVTLERVPMIRGRITEIDGVPVEQVTIGEGSAWAVEGDRQLTWGATPPGDSTVVAGEWWPATYTGPPLISLEADIARDFGVDVGDTLTFNILGRTFVTPIANIRTVRWDSMGINFAVVFAPGLLESVPHSQIATVRMPPEHEADLQRALSEQFPNISAIRIADVVDAVSIILRRIGFAVRLVAGVAVLAGVLVLGGAVATEHRRRVYDAVVLKVLGATRGDILRAYCLEYGMLGLVTAVIAGAVGCGVSYAVMTFVMRADWTLLPRTLLATTAGALALTLTAGMVGTWRALGYPASVTLRNE